MRNRTTRLLEPLGRPWNAAALLVLPLAAALAAAGCAGTSDGQAEGEPQGDRPVIGVSILTMANPFFVEMKDAMVEKGDELGYDVLVVAAEFDAARQTNQIDDFVARRVDAMILCPANSSSIAPAVQRANEAGIPVFTADIAVLADDVDIVSHVATDNFHGGQLVAETMVQALGGSGRVAIVDHPEIESVIQRTEGFQTKLDELRKARDVQIEVVAKVPGGGDRAPALRASEDLLQAHPDLDGIFAINDPSALGVLTALENAGKADDVIVIGFDGASEAVEAVQAGKMYATIQQHPTRIGETVVQFVADYSLGKDVPAEHLIPPTVITADK